MLGCITILYYDTNKGVDQGIIRFENVSKRYKDKQIITNISFTIHPKEIVVLVGESGCGKTTTLKMINALIKPSAGHIYVKERDIHTINPITLRRNMGYVIQQTGLFPHMTVKENIEIVGKLEKYSKEALSRKTAALLDMVGMDDPHFLHSYPSQLSGGQQQRIGVARAFMLDPDIILMDEPFSALDPVTRTQLQDELIDIQRQTDKTIIFVTHDMEEAVRIADRVCVLQKGQVAQFDSPENIMKNPANEYVENFVGTDRIWSAPELIRAEDIMITQVITGTQTMSIQSALRRMYRRGVNSLVITDRRRKVQGVISARMAAQVSDKTQRIKDVMDSDFSYAMHDQSLLEILPTVSIEDIHSIPVVDSNRRLMGLITQNSLMLTLSVPFVDEIELDFQQDGNGVQVYD